MDKTTKIIFISCVGVIVIAGIYFYVSSRNSAAATTTENTSNESCVQQRNPEISVAASKSAIKPQDYKFKPLYTSCATMQNRLANL